MRVSWRIKGPSADPPTPQSIHFPLLLAYRPRGWEEKTRMPASPAKMSCRARSPEARRGIVRGRPPSGTLGWRGLGQNSWLWSTYLSVLLPEADGELTGWPCKVCVCVCVCVYANQVRSGRYCWSIWGYFVPIALLWEQGSVLFIRLDEALCVPARGPGLDSLLKVRGTMLEGR